MENQDKPLENLFRDKAETFSDLSYREEDWTKLEKRLDELDLIKSYRRKIAILAAASVLLVGLMGYFTVTNHYKINEISEQVSQLEESQNSDITAERDGLVKVDEPENSPIIDAGDENNENTPDKSGKESAAEDITDNRPIDVGNNVGLTTVKTENIDKDVIIERADSKILAQNSLLFSSHQPVIKNKKINTSHSTTPPVSDSFVASSTNESNSPQKVSEVDFRKRSSITLGFVLSPDLSTAGGISNFVDPGFKGGVLAEYSISDRFSVRSGAILSNVRYKAGRNDYRAPEYWNFGVSPEETSALCLILDIPVSLKTILAQRDRSNFYVTGGISTYVMLSEEYEFDFGANASPALANEWQGQTGDSFWASNLSLSIGYEMDISNRIALRAEPHIYVPIREVGWGNVKLYSMGTSVSLNVRM